MSVSTSLSLVPQQAMPPPPLSVSHRQTFSVPNRTFRRAPNSTGHSIPLPIVTSASSPSSRLSLKETSQVTAKNVLFYKSGDANFESFKVAVTRRNFRTFDALLENLSEKVSLPFGVRTISTPNGTHGISRLDELEDGKAYICSDKKTVKPLNLRLAPKSKPPWFISKPKTRTRRLPTLARRSAQPSEASRSVPSRFTHVKSPKKIVVTKNGDPTFRHTVLLSRRTHQNFEQILDDVAEIFRVKQQKLFTCEGRRVESLQELYSGANVFVLSGKEPFVSMEYRLKRPSNDPSKDGSSAENTIESARMPKELKRTKGRWRVTVSTSELPAAGTDSKVILVVYGSKGNSGPIPLSSNNATGRSSVVHRDKTKKLFMSGNEDEFTVNVGYIGELRKIRICHDNSGKTSPGWLCEELVMSDLTTGEILTFPFNRWLSRDEDDGEICRELPASHHEDGNIHVLRYIVFVHTGDLWNAGTEANVFVTLYGTAGDSGARLLQIAGKSKPLQKGSIETFRLEAVDLGTLQRLVVGHDGTGPGAGWYLEKIVVREDRVGGEDHVFHCGRWLDEAQEDGKIVRELFVETKVTNSRLRQHSEKSKELELWEQEKWKFFSGNQIMFISKASGKAIRTKPDGSVDGLGPVSHPFDLVKIKDPEIGVYKVIRRRGVIRTFASAHAPSFHLAIDQNRLMGQGKGGSFCEFTIKVQPDRSVILESCRYPGHYVSIDGSGKPTDTRGHPTSTGRQFNVYVKGCFRNNSVILFNTSATQALVVTGVGDVVGTGQRGDVAAGLKVPTKSPAQSGSLQWAHFRVIKVAEGVRMFQCDKNPRRYLRIKDGQCDGLGTGDAYCHFKIQKYKHGAYVTLQSMKHRGVFIGLSSNGKARPTVDTGDSNTRFYPEVIKFGEKKQEKAAQYRTPEASFSLPEIAGHNRKQSSQTVSSSLRKDMAVVKSREYGSPGPNEGDFRIYVTTGNSGTKEIVTIAAYGDKGRSANITLGKGHEKGVFQCGQTDEFEANFAEIGRLYKIRIGVAEASANCDWRLKQVKMKDMTTNEIFRFKFNRWISRSKDDGDTLRELPAVAEGADDESQMLRYYIQVKTSRNSSNFSSKKAPIVFLCLCGERGDTGRRLLQKKSHLKTDKKKDSSKKMFMPNQIDIFEIEAVSLGTLTKCSLSCPTSLRNSSKLTSMTAYPALLCEEIVVREAEGATTEYIFSCNKWLGLKKAGSHALINLSLSEVRDISKSTSDEVDFQDGDWKLCVKTGAIAEAGTSANVTFYGCSLDGSNSGNVILQGGAAGKFEPGKTVKFKVSLAGIKNLHKVRISHDNEGPDPDWNLESLKLVDPYSDTILKLPVKKWLAADRDGCQLFTEVAIPKPGTETPPAKHVHPSHYVFDIGPRNIRIIATRPPGKSFRNIWELLEAKLCCLPHGFVAVMRPQLLTYQVIVYTGSILGSDTDANVYICIYGTTGDTGLRPLIKSKSNSTKFQESQVDVFDIDAVSLGDLQKIRIGHDGHGPGSGWFLHKVVIKESPISSKDWIFFCNKWLDHGQDDGKIEREIPVSKTPPSSCKTSAGKSTQSSRRESQPKSKSSNYSRVPAKSFRELTNQNKKHRNLKNLNSDCSIGSYRGKYSSNSTLCSKNINSDSTASGEGKQNGMVRSKRILSNKTSFTHRRQTTPEMIQYLLSRFPPTRKTRSSVLSPSDASHSDSKEGFQNRNLRLSKNTSDRGIYLREPRRVGTIRSHSVEVQTEESFKPPIEKLERSATTIIKIIGCKCSTEENIRKRRLRRGLSLPRINRPLPKPLRVKATRCLSENVKILSSQVSRDIGTVMTPQPPFGISGFVTEPSNTGDECPQSSLTNPPSQYLRNYDVTNPRKQTTPLSFHSCGSSIDENADYEGQIKLGKNLEFNKRESTQITSLADFRSSDDVVPFLRSEHSKELNVTSPITTVARSRVSSTTSSRSVSRKDNPTSPTQSIFAVKIVDAGSHLVGCTNQSPLIMKNDKSESQSSLSNEGYLSSSSAKVVSDLNKNEMTQNEGLPELRSSDDAIPSSSFTCSPNSVMKRNIALRNPILIPSIDMTEISPKAVSGKIDGLVSATQTMFGVKTESTERYLDDGFSKQSPVSMKNESVQEGSEKDYNSDRSGAGLLTLVPGNQSDVSTDGHVDLSASKKVSGKTNLRSPSSESQSVESNYPVRSRSFSPFFAHSRASNSNCVGVDEDIVMSHKVSNLSCDTITKSQNIDRNNIKKFGLSCSDQSTQKESFQLADECQNICVGDKNQDQIDYYHDKNHGHHDSSKSKNLDSSPKKYPEQISEFLEDPERIVGVSPKDSTILSPVPNFMLDHEVTVLHFEVKTKSHKDSEATTSSKQSHVSPNKSEMNKQNIQHDKSTACDKNVGNSTKYVEVDGEKFSSDFQDDVTDCSSISSTQGKSNSYEKSFRKLKKSLKNFNQKFQKAVKKIVPKMTKFTNKNGLGIPTPSSSIFLDVESRVDETDDDDVTMTDMSETDIEEDIRQFKDQAVTPFVYEFLTETPFDAESLGLTVLTPTSYRFNRELDSDVQVQKHVPSSDKITHYMISRLPTMLIPYKDSVTHVGTTISPCDTPQFMLNMKSESRIGINEDSTENMIRDGGEYQVILTTGVQSTTEPCLPDARVTMVVYGEEGKTGELPIQSILSGRESGMRRKSRSKSQSGLRSVMATANYFRPGQTDECKVDIPEIGQIYKIRISYNHMSNWKSWYLEKVLLQDVATKEQLLFPCNRWLSKADDDQETVREIALSADGHETLKTILYNVTIHTGDRHGAGTDANVTILLKGDRGDTGHRFLRKHANEADVFQRSAVDVFVIEAVDLGRLVEVIVSHDGEGYGGRWIIRPCSPLPSPDPYRKHVFPGAGWFVEKVTVRAGEFASQEWVFPCNLWLDDSIGDRRTSRRLFPVGMMNLETNEEELEGLGTLSSREGGRDDIWDLTVFVSDVQTDNVKRIHLMGTFYGSNGMKKSSIISMGEWSAGGRKRMKTQADLQNLGELYKLRVEIPDYEDSASLTLEHISMQNARTREQLTFAFHTQLYTDGGCTVRELPVLKPEKPLTKVFRYLIEVSMSAAKRHLPPSGILRLNLIGSSGDSGYRTLLHGSQSFHATEQKDGFIFRLDGVDMGRLSSAAIYYEDDRPDKGSGWTINSICASIDDHPSSTAVPSSYSMMYKVEPEEQFVLNDDQRVLEKEYQFLEVLSDNVEDARKASSYQRDATFKSARKHSQGVWNLILYLAQDKIQDQKSDEIVMLRDLERRKVSVQVFGSEGSSKQYFLSTLNPKQNDSSPSDVRSIETCLIFGESMGTLYLLRFSCKEWDSSLIKLKLKDVHTKQEFLFNITDAQHKKMETSKSNSNDALYFDVPLVRPDVPPLDHHSYGLTFQTGEQSSSGTDANISLKLFGTHGDTGTRQVPRRKWNSFATGKEDAYLLETVDVGMPRKICVSHDGKGLGAGWFLKEITVQEERNEKMADHVFQCYKWLDDGVDEKVTQKELYLTGTKFHYPNNFLKPSKGSWNCRLKAKDFARDDRDEPLIGKVAFYIKHRDGKNITVTKQSKFETNEVEFTVTFPEDNQKSSKGDEIVDDGFFKIRVEVVANKSSKERKDWPFEELLMTDVDSKEKLHFVFDHAVWDGSSRNIIRELPVMRTREKTLTMCDYYIMLFTANDSTSHSNQRTELEIMLSGDNGDTGWRQLRKKASSASEAILQPGKMDMLFVEAVDLGEKVKSVFLKVGEKNVKWKLDRIKVKKEFFSKDELVFDYGRWIEPMSIPNSEIKIPLTNKALSHSPKPPSVLLSEGVVEAFEIYTLWDIQSAETSSNEHEIKRVLPTLAVKLYGVSGESDLELFNGKLTGSGGRYSSGIKVQPREAMNGLKKIGAGIENFKDSHQLMRSQIKSITLLKLTARNTITNEYFSFSPEAVLFDNSSSELSDEKQTGTNWIDLVPIRPKEEPNHSDIIQYSVTVKTGNVEEAGTSANVYVILHGQTTGSSTDSGKRWLLGAAEKNKFSKGAQSHFMIKSIDLGDLKQVTVGHDGNDAKMGWWLESVTVKPSNNPNNFVFNCKKWLANLENDTFIERVLELSDVQNVETVPKRPISVVNPSLEDKQPSSIGNNESLHGSAKTGEKSSHP